MMGHTVRGLPMKKWGSKMVVNWGAVQAGHILIVDEHEVKIVSNEMTVKVAKTSGKQRNERRLQMTIDGVNIIEAGTESTKKGSFIKRLLKATTSKPKEEEVKVEQPMEQPQITIVEEVNPIEAEMRRNAEFSKYGISLSDLATISDVTAKQYVLSWTE